MEEENDSQEIQGMRVAETQNAAQIQDTSTNLAREVLRSCLEDYADELLRTIRLYVFKAKFAPYGTLDEVTLEIFAEVTAQVLAHAERFDSTRRPQAWILRIAGNIIKQRRDKAYRLAKREQPVTDLNLDPDAADISDSELFDRLAAINLQAFDQIAINPPETTFERQELLTAAIGQLSPDDRAVLRLAIKHDFDGNAIASELGIKPGTARVRLSRATQRLRASLNMPGGDEHE